jgi:uncharacterized membrane protein
MKSLRLAALAAALTLAACSSPAPTESAMGSPSFDEGPGVVDSGNRDGGTATTTSADSTGTPERGGNMLGSGN